MFFGLLVLTVDVRKHSRCRKPMVSISTSPLYDGAHLKLGLRVIDTDFLVEEPYRGLVASSCPGLALVSIRAGLRELGSILLLNNPGIACSHAMNG